MKKVFPLSILLLFASAATYADDNAKLLQQLDNVLDNNSTYELHKELHIQELKNQAVVSPSSEQKYWLLRELLNEYSVFDSDSALVYGEKALAIANDIGRQDLANDIHILNSYTLAATGLLQQSRQELNMVDQSCLDEMSKVDYWGQEVYLSTHECQYKNVNNETRENLVFAKNMLEEKRAYLNGEKMATNDNALYTISTELTKGQKIEITGISGLDEYFFDNDYFNCSEGNDEITFAPLDGYYKITLNTGTKAVAVTRLNADGSAGDYAGCHAIYMLGWGVGFPNQDYQNGWSTDNGLCMAEVAPNVFQFSGYAGPEHGSENGMKLRNDYVQFKFYQNKSWGHEYNTGNCQFVGNTADIINPDGGDFTYGGGAKVAQGDFIVVTLDLTEGEDNAKFSFEIK